MTTVRGVFRSFDGDQIARSNAQPLHWAAHPVVGGGFPLLGEIFYRVIESASPRHVATRTHMRRQATRVTEETR